MELRPFDYSLMRTCAENDICTNCPMRIGCSIRYSFYEPEISFELTLQMSELSIRNILGNDHLAFVGVQWLRHKRRVELGLNGVFSYV